MNGDGLWPIHIIFFGFLLALVAYAIKSIVLSPVFWVAAPIFAIAWWLLRKLR
jgi:hypothetical protein